MDGRVGEVVDQLDVFAHGGGQQVPQLSQGAVEVDAPYFSVLSATEGQQPLHQSGGLMAGGEDRVDVARQLGLGFHFRRQQLAITEDTRQEVVEIVGHAPRQLADGV